ncbi:MAG: GNAT family N-acetyltransferase [Chitinophagaceae bacterium]|nr:GNAT family N-acetyltransferase [Chitinophagaceae bacterium]
MAKDIRYIPQQDIDTYKWDQCIEKATNGLIYGYSFYLDQMAVHWDALVINDYEAVMPLTWNSRWGIKYLYQPFITAQLGIYGQSVTPALTDDFIKSIPPSFRYIDILLNAGNHPLSTAVSRRSNYILPLNRPYDTIADQYNENLKRNIKKSEQAGLTLKTNIDVELVIRLAAAQMREHGHESADNINRFRNLFTVLQEKNMARTYGIFQGEQLGASAVFFLSHQRLYYILVGNHPSGREMGASHALIDTLIREQAGTGQILDFEGSDIPGLAAYYRAFGAVEEPYPALKINRLPFFLKWLKK